MCGCILPFTLMSCECPFIPVLRPGLFPKEDSEIPRRSSQARSSPTDIISFRCIGAHNGNGRICTATRDVRLRQMSIRFIEGSPSVRFAERDRRLFASQRGIAVHPFASQRGIAVRPFADRSSFVRSQKDICLHRSLVSPKGLPIARLQKDVRLQEGKKLFVNKVLPKKSLRT